MKKMHRARKDPVDVAISLAAQYGPWIALKSLKMYPDEPQRGVDVSACLADIEAHGFHLTDAHRPITHLVTG
ncbi:hypothetical protein [Paraburkholderia haematera]|jgi:hypothetical protein|uniref:Uncharacterized protein n=1 Tax=Paraburkholderia haematera TaxID=2793077 RepID=A0ABN7MJP1_9BURK|nr:hypothetical protein [Paraburkholderia haematera]CAE6806687.1 hypothetical protein R69888_05466 [Paraburkholderia haematera]